MNIQDSLAQNTKYYRKRLNISQEELAARCGLARAQVGLIENGKNITIDTLARLACGLNVAPMRLLVSFEEDGTPQFDYPEKQADSCETKSSESERDSATNLKNCALVYWGSGGLEFQELSEDSLDPSIKILSILAQTTESDYELLKRYKAIWPQVMALLNIRPECEWK